MYDFLHNNNINNNKKTNSFNSPSFRLTHNELPKGRYNLYSAYGIAITIAVGPIPLIIFPYLRWYSIKYKSFIFVSTISCRVFLPLSFRFSCAYLFAWSSFSALTLLVGWHEGHLACRNVGCWYAGCDDLSWSSARLKSSSKVVAAAYFILSSTRVQNRDILIPAYPGCTGKWPSVSQSVSWYGMVY